MVLLPVVRRQLYMGWIDLLPQWHDTARRGAYGVCIRNETRAGAVRASHDEKRRMHEVGM